MYRNERDFSRAFCAALKKEKMHPVPIETGMTQQGVPDLFVMTKGDDTWIELKNIWFSYELAKYQIPWRPGQQAWHSKYYKHHSKKKCVFTVVALKEGFLVIPMVKIFDDDIVSEGDYTKCKTIKEVITIVC